MANQKTAVLLRTDLRMSLSLHSEEERGPACIISEHARSSGHCLDCPHWLRSLSSGEALRCQRTLMATMSPFSHSPVLSLELLHPAGRLSLFSTSSFCSGTTPSPTGLNRQKMSNVLLLWRQKNNHRAITALQQRSLDIWQLFSTAAIKYGCSVPSATWHLPVFPWLNSHNHILVSQSDD